MINVSFAKHNFQQAGNRISTENGRQNEEIHETQTESVDAPIVEDTLTLREQAEKKWQDVFSESGSHGHSCSMATLQNTVHSVLIDDSEGEKVGQDMVHSTLHPETDNLSLKPSTQNIIIAEQDYTVIYPNEQNYTVISPNEYTEIESSAKIEETKAQDENNVSVGESEVQQDKQKVKEDSTVYCETGNISLIPSTKNNINVDQGDNVTSSKEDTELESSIKTEESVNQDVQCHNVSVGENEVQQDKQTMEDSSSNCKIGHLPSNSRTSTNFNGADNVIATNENRELESCIQTEESGNQNVTQFHFAAHSFLFIKIYFSV